jgi:hypothetical protein
MFALKEDRLTFMEKDLVELVAHAGFIVERVIPHLSRQASIGNWLRASGLPAEVQERIREMHLELNDAGRRAYDLTVTADDILCDFSFITVVARKPGRSQRSISVA